MVKTDELKEATEEALQKCLKEASDYKYALEEACIVAITDQKGIIKYANDNFCKISIYSCGELIGEDHRIVNSGYHPKEFIHSLWLTIASGKIWKGELKNKAKDGSTYWVDTTIVPFLNEQGKPYQYIAISADITERKKLEEEQALFVSIVNSSDEAILSTTIGGKITSWNNGAEKILGYSAKEIIGRDISILIPAHLQIQENEIMEKVFRGEVVDYFETTRIKKDGKVIYVSLTISPVKDSLGNITGASKISRDITEQKKAEENLQKSLREASEYKHALEESSIVAITDEEGIIKYANQNFSKTTKYSVDELIGKSHIIINSEYHPKEFVSNLWATIAKGKIWRGELKHQAKDGSVYWVDTSIVPFLNEQDKVYQYITIHTDITERKLAEEELHAAHERLLFHIENTPLGYIEWDNQLRIKTLSKRAEEIFGWNKQDFIEHKKTGYSHVYKEDLPWVSKITEQLLSGELERNEIQHRSYTKDGRIIWCEWFNSVLKDKDGKVVTIMSQVQDITESKKMSLVLKKTQDELRMLLADVQSSSEEERKSIAREIHDELGQVLTALKIDASMLRKKISAKSNGDKEFIEKEFNSMIKLIDSTIGSVKRIATELRPEVLDHLGIVEAVKWQAKEFENKTGIHCITTDLQSHLELSAPLATTVYRVVQEALTNIARHSKATVVNLLVGIDAKNLLIEIKDNGKGINSEETEGIKSLGLIGMRERVLLLNGTISIEGKPGKGTFISVKIPL